jgi:ligand-binding sensor domain-containing protein
MSVLHTSCGQNQTNVPKADIKSEPKGVITSHGPTTSVRTIRQDRKGNMWIVSVEGIIRYDGKSFTNFTTKVGAHKSWDVLEDRLGNIWFGASRYDGKSFRTFTTKDGLPSEMVFSIYEDNKGNIWFGTYDGASRYDGKSFRTFKMKEGPPPSNAHSDSVRAPAYHKEVRHREPDELKKFYEDYWMINEGPNRVHAIIEDKTGKFWIGTWAYAGVYDARLPDGQGKLIAPITNGDGKPFTKISSIIEDKKGNIWLGERDGLWRFDGTTFTRITGNSVGDVFEDSKGNIWTSSGSTDGERWALSRYDEKSLADKKPTVTEIKSGDNGLFGISEAPDGSIWVGATDGVYRYNGKTIKRL